MICINFKITFTSTRNVHSFLFKKDCPVKIEEPTRFLDVESNKPATFISNEEAQILIDDSDKLFKRSKFREATECLNKIIACKSCRCPDCRYFYSEGKNSLKILIQ